MDLYQNMGFNNHPFSSYSAEEEKGYLDKIFTQPKYFNSVYADIKNGNSRFISGERGIGKTALIYSLESELDKEEYFVTIIDRYDNVGIVNNNKDLLIEVLRKSVTQYSITLEKNKGQLKKLSKYEKEKLAFFIENFFTSLSPAEFENIYDKAHSFKTKNFLKRIFNSIFLKPTNTFISGVSEIISSNISKSLGLPSNTSSQFYKAYFPEMKIENPKNTESYLEDIDYHKLKSMVEDFFSIVRKSGFNNVVIFFDKIDEYSKLGGDIKKISKFIEELTNDTELLQMDYISFVFLIWNKVKKELNASGTRYDKFKPIDINWSKEELKLILEKRVKYFSNDKVSVENMFEDPSRIEELLDLAYKSPRHLIVLLSRIYDEQSRLNNDGIFFTNDSVDKGISSFIQNFDYHSLYPGKTNTTHYIVKVINKILRVGKIEFVAKDLATEYKTSSQVANNNIQAMKGFALIKDIDNTGSIEKKYTIIDPKLKYAIKHGIEKIAEDY